MVHNAAKAALGTVLAVFSLAACATVPKTAHEEPLRLLLSPERVLVSCNLENSRAVPELLLNRFMEPKDAGRFLDRTDKLHILLPSPGDEGGSYTLLGKGRYPRRLSNFAFAREEQWEKRKDPLSWWEHRSSALQIAVLPEGYIVLSTGAIREAFDRLFGGTPGTLPASVEKNMQDAAVTIYAPRTEGLLRQVAGGTGGRVDFGAVETFESALYPDNGDGFTVRGEFSLRDSGKARAFALGFRLLLISSARNEGPEQVQRIIQKTEIESSERRVKFRGIPVSSRHIEQLLYSVVSLPVPAGGETVILEEDG